MTSTSKTIRTIAAAAMVFALTFSAVSVTTATPADARNGCGFCR